MKRKDFPHAVNAGTAKEEENDGTVMDEENDRTAIWEENDGTAIDEESDTTDMEEENDGTAEKGDETGHYTKWIVFLLEIVYALLFNRFKTKKSDDVKQKVVPEKEATRPCDKIKHCDTNPGHKDFIRVNYFDIKMHLPKAYQDEVYDLYIRSVIGLTVHIRHEGIDLDVGSGMVCNVDRRFDKVDKSHCPCKICDRPRPNYGRYKIRTAKHAVPTDEKSLEDATVYLNYDNGKQLNSCDKLYASQIKESSKLQDCCSVLCVSHDKTLCKEIEKRLKEYDSHYDKLVNKTKNKKRGVKKLPVICVSHPHGSSKRISVGEMQCVKKGQPDAWKYTTPTCDGCSGAPVFILGEKMQGKDPYHISVHTTGGKGYNKSADWAHETGNQECGSELSKITTFKKRQKPPLIFSTKSFRNLP